MKTILTVKTILLLTAAIALLATTGCVVDDRGYHHDHAVVVAPAPVVVVHPGPVVVH